LSSSSEFINDTICLQDIEVARNSKQVDGIIGAMDFRLTASEIAELQYR
jgi:hypothetical protein